MIAALKRLLRPAETVRVDIVDDAGRLIARVERVPVHRTREGAGRVTIPAHVASDPETRQ
jgi:hypothetical protein